MGRGGAGSRECGWAVGPRACLLRVSGGGWAGVTERTGGACSCWPGWLFVCAPRPALPGPRVRPARPSPRPPRPVRVACRGTVARGGRGVCPGLLGGAVEVPAGCFPLGCSVARLSSPLGLCPCECFSQSLCSCVCVSPPFSLVCL